ncbi:hypothetical protein AAG612_03240 [Citromicrobium bathyomarinum]|uniref:hypothetical protein n=1 Tax=Citromicrobium bathyomarinum TaxID=72174 RepID=UPI00315A7631
MKEQYLEYVIARYIRSTEFDQQIGTQWIFYDQYDDISREIAFRAFAKENLIISSHAYRKSVDDIFDVLEKGGGIIFDGDEYSDRLFKLIVSKKDAAVDAFLSKHEVANRLNRIGSPGPEALARALKKIAAEDGQIYPSNDLQNEKAEEDFRALEELNTQAPASDRIVRLDHNQISELDDEIKTLVDEVESLNSIDGPDGFRNLIVGQLKAGRALIDEGVFRLYSIQVTLVNALTFLAKRYENELIGSLATSLLTALAIHLGIPQ